MLSHLLSVALLDSRILKASFLGRSPLEAQEPSSGEGWAVLAAGGTAFVGQVLLTETKFKGLFLSVL